MGLEWLLLVEGGVIVPREAPNDLAVTPTRSLAEVLEHVTEAGYMESDGYGQHEGLVLPVVGGEVRSAPGKGDAQRSLGDDHAALSMRSKSRQAWR